MRLAGFAMESYGPFRDCRLEFDARPGVLNLLVAPNGFGKSVLRRAMHDLLFNIHAQSPMGYLHGFQQMRLRAELVTPEGRRVLVRRKGQGNTLADETGAAVPPDALLRLLGGADARMFEQLFGLDTGLLRKGGAELLKTEGRLGQVLFAGGGGLARVRPLLEGLTERRDQLGRADRRHVSRPIWASLQGIEHAQRDMRESALRPEEWRELERRAEAAETRQEELRRDRAQLASELERLRMIRSIRPALAARRDALARLAQVGDAPRLDAEFEKSWRAALVAHVEASSTAAAAAQREAAQREANTGLGFDQALVDAAREIAALADDRAVAGQARGDLPAVRRRMDAAAAEIARLRLQLGWGAEVQAPPSPAIRAARQRLTRGAELATAARRAMQERDKARDRLAALQREREALPPAPDLTACVALAAALRAEGDPGRRLEQARARLREAEAALREARTALPGPTAEDAALDAAIPPSPSVVSALEAALGDAEAALRAAGGEQERLARETARLAGELDTLSRRAALPPPDALAEARARRDRLWTLLQDPDPASPAERQAATGGATLAVAFDRALREADAVADALIAHSTDMAKAGTMRERLAALHAEAEQAKETAERADAGLAEARARLADAAVTAGAPATVSVAELRSFLAARQVVLDRRLALARARDAEADLVSALISQGAELAATMDRPAPSIASLPALLAAVDQDVQEGRALHTRHVEAAGRLRDGRAEAETREAEAARAAAAHAEWDSAWREAARALERPADEPVEATEAALELMEELRKAETAHREDSVRARDMQASITAFTAAEAALAARLAPDLAGHAPGEAAPLLAQRCQAEREKAARAATLAEALKLAEREAQSTAAAAQSAGRHFSALCAALNADTREAAEQQLLRVHEALDAETRLAEAEGQLRILGGGQETAELARQAEAITAEAEEAEIAALTARAAELSTLVQEQAAEHRSAVEARDRAAGADGTAMAAARRESALAALSRSAEQALLLHAASALLKAGLERQRAASESTLLRRIGAVFRNLTCDVHAGVAVEEIGASQRLVALEADGRGRKQLDELSEGTADQLYLALRIIALEEYAAGASPLPFIADDVLQTFDDDRTLAGLRALTELSRHVQVIALTHHPHVASLARSLPEGSVREVIFSDATL